MGHKPRPSIVALGMKPAAIAGAALLLLAGCQQPQVVVQTASSQPTGLNLTGTATVRVKPTLVVLQLGASFKDARPTAAKDKTEAVIVKVVEAMRRAGVGEAEIQTTRFSLGRYTEPDGRITGWACSSDLEIRVKKVESAGAILEAALDAGANQVRGVEYTVEELQKVRAQARDEAVQVVKAKADQYARGFGVKVGRPRHITENAPYGWSYARNTMTQSLMQNYEGGASSGPADEILSSGSVEVTLTVTVTYDLN